ncbi:MAG: E3 ubiquitin protein ligase, partial [Planctomycetes bacterium]|nr:E3 ubiquitin protein ligase [Planctomycetota bacterium]
MEFFSGTPQVEAGTETAELIENFHRIRNNTTLFGPVPDRETNIDVTHHALINSFHQVGQQLAARRKGKGKGGGKHGKHLLDVPMFSGSDGACTICTEPLLHGERVVRLQCQHVFHEMCWSDFAASHDRPTILCCNCRHHMNVDDAIIAHFHYLEATGHDQRQ